MPRKLFKKVAKVGKSLIKDVVSAVTSGNVDPASIARSVATKNVRRLAKRAGVADAIGKHAAQKMVGNMESMIKGIKGRGDYISESADLDHNVLIHGVHGTAKPIPQFSAKSMKDGRSMMIAHREFIKDVPGSIAFRSERYNIDPTNATTFPWLSTIAPLFQKFRFHGCVFEFNSTSSNALTGTNTALGTVILVQQTNAHAANFTTKVQMENTYGAISAKPSNNIACGVECSPALVIEPSYIRHAGDIGVMDVRLNQGYGYMQYATVGMQAQDFIIGEMWVSYMVELIDPILGVAPNSILPVAHYSLDNTVGDAFFGQRIFGTTRTELVNTMGVTIEPLSVSNRILIPASAFVDLPTPVNIVMSYVLQGDTSTSNLTGFGGTATNAVNNNIYTLLGVPSSASQVASAGGLGSSFYENNAWTVTDPTQDVILDYITATCVFPLDASPVVPLCGDLFISIYNASL